jgi:hypothetical protein
MVPIDVSGADILARNWRIFSIDVFHFGCYNRPGALNKVRAKDACACFCAYVYLIMKRANTENSAGAQNVFV